MENDTNNNASGYGATAEGIDTSAIGMASHTEGYQTNALATSAHAEGSFSNASGVASHAEGYQTQATEASSHAEGNASIATGIGAHAEGFLTIAGGRGAHAEGFQSNAGGVGAHAEGANSSASGNASHAEGLGAAASGNYAHAEGNFTTASGDISHAEGNSSIASGIASHAEGQRTIASGAAAHAEGSTTQAIGFFAHAEGLQTVASGTASHAEGLDTHTLGIYSHAEGGTTFVASSHSFSHIMGQYGQTLYPHSWHVANGTPDAFSLAAVLQGATGNLYIDGTVMSPAADYAEMFETVDGLPIEPGYFVTVDGDQIRIATEGDRYILGVTSGRPSIVGGAYHLNWQGRYAVDEWGRVKYEDMEVPAEKDERGNTIIESTIRKIALANPEYDASLSYTSRMDRPEWVAVGLLGKLLVRDDGTCMKNGFCHPNADGIATASEEGYRVLKRTGVNQILIMFAVK